MKDGLIATAVVSAVLMACPASQGQVPDASGAAFDEGGAVDSGRVVDSGTVSDASVEFDAGPSPDAGRAEDAGVLPLRVLAFMRTAGYRHDSIQAAKAALAALAADGGWGLTLTEDPGAFSSATLAQTDVIAFVLTSGDVLEAEAESRVEAFVRQGGGFVGVHSAHDTEYGWPFYGELIGAYFKSHPAVQSATIRAEDPNHPLTLAFAPSTVRIDEWYDFVENPRPRVEVLLTVDETSYSGGTMGADHPIAWCRVIDSGRTFTTALGHTESSWREPAFLEHLAAGLRWSARRPR